MVVEEDTDSSTSVFRVLRGAVAYKEGGAWGRGRVDGTRNS